MDSIRPDIQSTASFITLPPVVFLSLDGHHPVHTYLLNKVIRATLTRCVVMAEPRPTLQWAEQTLKTLSEQGYTGTVTIGFEQGGVQGITVNQELQPRQHATIVQARPLT